MAEEALPDVETWDEIKVTALFTSISMAAFIIVFEVCRRLPSVSFVFDKRRASKPHRTPPPLIKSRYFEWLFVSTDPAYSECADMAFQKGLIKERAARRKNKRRRRGSGDNRGTTVGSGNEGVGNEPSKKPKTNNSNAPVYPPKKPNMSSHISSRQMKQKKLLASRAKSVPVDIDAIDDDDDSSSDQEKQTSTNKSDNDNDNDNGPVDLDASSSDGEHSKNDSDDDKFQVAPPPPPKGNRKTYDGSSSLSPRSEKMRKQPQQKSCISNDATLQSNDTTVVISNTTTTTNNNITNDYNTNINNTPSTQKRKQYAASPSSSLVRFHDDIDNLEKGISTTPLPPSSPASKKQHQKRTHAPYHFSIVEVDGRRLPAEIAEYAIAGDLTETQLEEYERWVCEWEDEEEHRFKERLKLNSGGVLSRWRFLGFGITTSATKGKGEDKDRSGAGGSVSRSRRSQQNGDGRGAIEMTTLSPASKHRKCHSNGGGTTTTITNRHLSANGKVHRRPLNRADEELLRCVGLDAFVMIRFLRFGFDVTFYPFVVACLVLIPTYYTNPYQGDESQGIVTSGYFRVTMTRLQPGCWRLWITWSFAVGFYMYILRRIWIEWETFVALRFDFLANGDGEEMDVIVHQEYESERERSRQIKLQVQQFRNSCMVEFVPESHRRDKELYEFFDALFPGQVKRAVMMLNAGQLTKLIQERQRYIVKYEDLYAKYFHARANYRQKMLCDDNNNPTYKNNSNNTSTTCHYLCCCCCALQAKKPSEPIVKTGGYYLCCNRKMVKALPYYLSEIKRLNRQIEEEHRRILTEKERIEDKYDARGFIASGISHGVTFVTGGFGRDLTCDTGFVEFKNLTTKQSATQCNIGGTMEYMETISAPDPRDIVWENATVPRSTIRWKVLQTDALLFTGTLFWGAVVTLVTSISKLDSLDNVLPSWLIPQNDTFMYSLIQGYLPVITLELLMIFLPFVFKIVASTYIRHKTKSEIEKFVFLWHFAYRLANLLVIIISGSFTESLDALANNPELFVLNLAAGIGKQSQFFLNNVIVQAGSETMWELAQVPDMVKHFIMYKFITVDAKSRRALEKLQMSERLNFGEILPSFIFTFMVAMVYCCQVPIVIGACSVVFYFASKVYHHQALFVYANSYEGGGKLMYPLNRMIFVTLYITMCLFSIMLGLKEATILASLFVFLVGAVTYVVDRKVQKTFVEPSLTLALTNARIIDEENKRKALRIQQYKEYKKLKRDKRKAAFKAAAHAKRMARAAVKKRQQQQKEQQNDDHSSPRSASLFPPSSQPLTPSSMSPSPLYDKNNHENPTPLKLFRDESDTPEKQRQSKQRQRQKPNYEFDADNNYDSSDNEARTTDFYCYRQPQLNKALWETKPRPYR